jgi:hypothetical protein
MFVCQWHLDVPYGKQGEGLAAMRAWGAEKFASSEFRVVYRVLDERPG